MLNHLTYLADHACAIPKRAELDSAIEARVRELIGEHARCCAIWAYMIVIRHAFKHIPERVTSSFLGMCPLPTLKQSSKTTRNDTHRTPHTHAC